MVHVIEEKLRGPLFDSPIFSEYFSGMRLTVADIETTGLSPVRSAVILGGAVVGDRGDRKAVQYFADTVRDERELLTRYAELLSETDVAVTFNGQKFDLPFLRKKNGTSPDRHVSSRPDLFHGHIQDSEISLAPA